MAILSRYVLAELAYDREDMNEIYQGYAFFNYLEGDKKHYSQYSELCSKLKSRYDSLLIEDRKKAITPGIYVAAMESTKYGSYMIVQLSRSGNAWFGKILGGEGFHEDKFVKKSQAHLEKSIKQAHAQSSDENITFSVLWNKYSQKDPNVELSQTMAKSGYNFAREMAGVMNAGNYTPDEIIVGTLVTETVRGIFTGIGELVGSGSAKNFSTELVWSPLNGGAINAKLIVTKISQSTYQNSPEKDTYDIPLKLYKLYPHVKAFFIDNKSKSVYFPDVITGQNPKKDDELQWLQYAHPIIFDRELAPLLGIEDQLDLKSLKKNKKLNTLMHKLFVRNAAFPHFFTDSIAAQFPPLNECDTYYSYQQIIYKNPNKSGQYAVIDRDGTEIYNLFAEEDDGLDYVNAYDDRGYIYVSKGSGTNRTAEISYTSGATYSGEVYLFSREGQGVYKMADGKIMKGRFHSNNFVEGELSVPLESATATISYSRYEPDSIAHIEYKNGDFYVGSIDSEYRPHGNGTLTQKGKKPKKTYWENGKMITKKNRATKKNRKYKTKAKAKK